MGKALINGEIPHSKIPFWRLVYDPAPITHEILTYSYPGLGTLEDPYAVTWIPENDPRNPLNFSGVRKWCITVLVAFCTLTVALVSSTYTGSTVQIKQEFGVGEEAVVSGLSVFVFGFSLGPLIWSPLSEVFGRRNTLAITFSIFTAFNAGIAGAQNIQTLIVLRFFSGCFGSSAFGNAGGVIADMFPAAERGIALSMYTAAPFIGPSLGPVIGGFLGMARGWRWVEGLLAILTGFLFLIITVFLPETYAPVLLRRRAAKLSQLTGDIYLSKTDIDRKGQSSLFRALSTALSRPWTLLFTEPIVLLLSIYMAIIYGTLYMLFAPYPIVFQEIRGWNQGIGGLPFLGVLVGTLAAAVYNFPEHKRYRAKIKTKKPAPEERLPQSIIGAIAAPIGLFWFAWTNGPSIHWMSSIAAGAPFGFGLALVFLSVMNYLVDSYAIFAASVLAANTALRSLFAAIFPLFTTYMYHGLGTNWAASIPAFLALACAPFPFIFYRYGPAIRRRCPFAAEAEEYLNKLHAAKGVELKTQPPDQTQRVWHQQPAKPKESEQKGKQYSEEDGASNNTLSVDSARDPAAKRASNMYGLGDQSQGSVSTTVDDGLSRQSDVRD